MDGVDVVAKSQPEQPGGDGFNRGRGGQTSDRVINNIFITEYIIN